MNTENNLANISFLCLFASFIFFWIGTSFSNLSIIKRIAKFLVIISNVLISFLLILRWKESGHFPLSNLYESLMFLSWCFTLSNLLLENPASLSVKGKETTRLQNSLTREKREKRNLEVLSFDSFSIVGAVSIPSALFTNAFATFILPKEMQEASSLVPALQSNWLMMHVTVMILSYAALILGSLLSIAFLTVTFFSQNSSKTSVSQETSSVVRFHSLGTSEMKSCAGGCLSTHKGALDLEKRDSASISTQEISESNIRRDHIEPLFAKEERYQPTPLLSFLDNLSYRFLGFGFPLLTIGILSGAVWANEAWGSYWSWDPKETWAFLTWLVFAIYLHLRLSYGLEGEKPAYVASFGFVIVWICFLGVNFIGEGLHSYGWILKS